MSVSWASRIAWPGSRQDCHHPQCRRFTRWSAALMVSAVAAEFGLGIARPADGVPAVITAAVIFAAGTVLACWPHPAVDPVLALADVIRECRCCSPTPPRFTGQITVPDHVPDEWTRENS